MSAIRSNTNRAEARKKRSTPYARVVVNSVFRFLGFVPAEDAQDSSDKECIEIPHPLQDATNESSSNVTVVSDNSLRQSNANASRDHLVISSSVNIVQSGSSSSEVPLAKPGNTSPGHAMDIDETCPHFVFTYSAPGSSSFSSLAESARNDTPTSTPKKKLERNPNGVYRWEGAGSAKHVRSPNRYASPAFGASPLKQARVAPKDNYPLAETSSADSKRRKVGDDGMQGARQSLSESTPSGVPVPFPATSTPTTPRTNGTSAPATPRTNGVSAKPSPIASSSRLRTPAKPTAPVVPSPLRQAWSDSSSPSSRDETKQGPSHSSKQTKTANFMAELIKETTPPKKPDLSNPYQTASPVGKVGPPRRGTKRPRATGKPAVPDKAGESGKQRDKDIGKEKDLNDYSTQAIIEATVPKGSKRSRPPAHFEKRDSSEEGSHDSPPPQREPPVIVETRKQVYTVEEPDEDDGDSGRANKKAKPSISGNGLPSSIRGKETSPSTSDLFVEEIGNDAVKEGTGKEKEKEMLKLVVPAQTNDSTSLASANSPTSRSGFAGFKPSSIPKEPSKLRFSFQAEGSSVPPSPAPVTPVTLPQTPPLPKSKSEFKPSPPSGSFSFTFKADDKAISPKSQSQPLKQDENTSSNVEVIKAKVRAMEPSSLPKFVFSLSASSTLPSSADHTKMQNTVKALPVSSLPAFEFGSAKSAAPFSFNYDPSKPKPSSSYTSKPSPPKTAKPGFSGFTLPKVPSSGLIFGGEASKPTESASGPSSTPVQGFNFAAAGMKPPTVKKDTWTCSLCGLSNPSPASKCETCETPSPSGPPASAVQGFDFAAAGMKPPTTKKDSWACSLCGLSNPLSASKCETCETPSPSGSLAPVVQGFNFAAAGFKFPTASKGTWTCSLCGLSSPDSASKCVACETPK